MNEFPLERYKFFVVNNMVVAVSSFAGHRVRATAKCDPRDKFDLEKGKRLAAARCNLKVAEKRRKHAHKQYLDLMREYQELAERVHSKRKYFSDSCLKESEAIFALEKTIKEMEV